MQSPTATSHALRLLVCLRCGAPFETAPSGGHHTCAYCGATHALAPRDERPETFAGAGALPPVGATTEEERIAALRAQMTSPHPYNFPPPELRGLARSATDVSRITEVEALFRATQARVAAGGGFDAEIALFWITGVLRTMYLMKRDYPLARAVDESALEALTDPVLRTVQRTSLANRACDAWDLEDAETWLAPCPRTSDVLAVHTHVRITEARIALMRGRYEDVLERLGARADDVPFRIDRDAMACLYRADAYERLSRLDEAGAALDASTRYLGGKIYALGKITDLKDAWPRMPLCAASYPGFRRRALRQRAIMIAAAGGLLLALVTCVASALAGT